MEAFCSGVDFSDPYNLKVPKYICYYIAYALYYVEWYIPLSLQLYPLHFPIPLPVIFIIATGREVP